MAIPLLVYGIVLGAAMIVEACSDDSGPSDPPVADSADPSGDAASQPDATYEAGEAEDGHVKNDASGADLFADIQTYLDKYSDGGDGSGADAPDAQPADGTPQKEGETLADKTYPFMTLGLVSIAPENDPACVAEDHPAFWMIKAFQQGVSASVFIEPQSNELQYDVVDDTGSPYSLSFTRDGDSTNPTFWSVEGFPPEYSADQFFCFYNTDDMGYEFAFCAMDLIHGECVLSYEMVKEAIPQ